MFLTLQRYLKMMNEVELSCNPIALDKVSIHLDDSGDPPNNFVDDDFLLLSSLYSFLLVTFGLPSLSSCLLLTIGLCNIFDFTFSVEWSFWNIPQPLRHKKKINVLVPWIFTSSETEYNRKDYQEYHDIAWSYTRCWTLIVMFNLSSMSNDKEGAYEIWAAPTQNSRIWQLIPGS
jgi:hypothetical protein